MISEQSKTLAFLARRVGALEKKVETLESTQAQLVNIIDRVVANQERWAPYFEQQHLENKADHLKVLKKLDKLSKCCI